METKTHRFNLFIEPSLIAELDKLAKSEGKSKAEVMRELIKIRLEECKAAA